MKFFFLLALLTTPALASESIESADSQLMNVKAHELAAKYGKESVVVVYDIDNTLLTANQDLGSDQWFNWQVGVISSGDKESSVASDINGLIDVQAQLYSNGKMHAVDEANPALVASLQREGFDSILLTSRGTNNRDATDRELSRNGYDLSIRPLGAGGVAGAFLPYDIAHVEDACISQDEAKALKLGAAHPVTLMNGLFMTSGQHKGAMLQSLLCRLGRKVKAVLFLDDTPKNVVKMHDALDATGVDVVTIRYSKLDPEVKRFNDSDKAPVVAAWKKWKQTLDETFR